MKLRRKAGSALAAVLTGFRIRLHHIGLRQIAGGMRYVTLPRSGGLSLQRRGSKVRKARRENPELDDIVVVKIKRREIPAAVDVRNKLVKLLDVAKVGPEPTKILVSGDKTFDRAFESAQDRGVENIWLRRFKRFRGELQVSEFMADLERMSPEQQDKCLYEIGKIQQSIERIYRQRGR